MHWNRKDSGRNLSAQSCTDPGEPPVKKGHPAGGILVQDGKGAAYGKKDSEDIYRHFKGRKYRILYIATCTETGEDMVIFETEEGPHKVYASALEAFLSPLDTGRYPRAEQKYRFELCRDLREGPAAELRRQGSTTALILKFLELEDNGDRIQFLQRHQTEIDGRFLTAAAESLEFAENGESVEERLAALMRFLRTKMKYEGRRLR